MTHDSDMGKRRGAVVSNPAKDLADEVRAIVTRGDPRTDAKDIAALREALDAYDAWKPWDDDAVVERVVQAVRRCESIDGVRLVSGDGDGGWRLHRDYAVLIARVAVDALKAALGGE